MNNDNKEAISRMVFAIAEGSRKNMINVILDYCGDEFESVNDMIELAGETDEQIKFRLVSIVEYYLNEEE